MLTIERLKEVLDFDTNTGIFIWKQKRGTKSKGSIAGSPQNKGYIQIMIDGQNYLAHRLAWFYFFGKWPKKQIDHINRNKIDNSINNLRDVDNSTNHHNVGIRKHNKSGVTGVYYSRKKNVWVSTIEFKTKKIYIGQYKTLEEATIKRKEKELMLQEL